MTTEDGRACLEALSAAPLGHVVQLPKQAPRKLVHQRRQRLRDLPGGVQCSGHGQHHQAAGLACQG